MTWIERSAMKKPPGPCVSWPMTPWLERDPLVEHARLEAAGAVGREHRVAGVQAGAPVGGRAAP